MFPWMMPGQAGTSNYGEARMFLEWMEEREKKSKEEAIKKAKEKKGFMDKLFPGATKREIFWYMFFLSPVVGIPVSYGYLYSIKSLLLMVQDLLK